MSTIGSSLSKGQDGTALINPSAIGQLAGVPKDLSRAMFDAAVAQERSNITNNGTGVWSAGEKLGIFGELGTRIWFVGANAALSHARNVSYQGQIYALAGDANVFGPTTGAPTNSTGANGDYLVDSATGLTYGPKASGAWPAGVATIGGTNPNYAAFVARLAGIERADLRATYGAPLDGTPHFLNGEFASLALAQAAYPAAGITSDNLSAMSRDTAAFKQAYSDLAPIGGIIGLCDGAKAVLSEQWNIQNAQSVWLHGGRNVLLLTALCGTTPAVKIQNSNGVIGPVLLEFNMQAQASAIGFPGNGGGVRSTAYTAGATAIEINNCQGIDIISVGWNGYDDPILQDDNTFGISFRKSGGGGNNYGFRWKQRATGLNSFERLTIEDGSFSNNNIGIDIEALYGPNSNGDYFSQGGSVFIKGNSIDYNIVQQIRLVSVPAAGQGAGYSNASCHVTDNHIETTGACSGNSVCRVYSQSAAMISHNEITESDANVPAGVVEVADNTACTFSMNRINNPTMPCMWSGTAAPKLAMGHGNIMQNVMARAILMQDLRGVVMQPMPDDGGANDPLFADIDPTTWIGKFGKTVVLDYFSGDGPFTLPARNIFAFPAGYLIEIANIGKTYITLQAATGAYLTSLLDDPKPFRIAPNTTARARCGGQSGEWIVWNTVV